MENERKQTLKGLALYLAGLSAIAVLGGASAYIAEEIKFNNRAPLQEVVCPSIYGPNAPTNEFNPAYLPYKAKR